MVNVNSFIDAEVKNIIRTKKSKIAAIKYLREKVSVLSLREAYDYVNNAEIEIDIGIKYNITTEVCNISTEEEIINAEDAMNDIKKIVKDAIEKHNIKIVENDTELEDLVRYVFHIGYATGYQDGCAEGMPSAE